EDRRGDADDEPGDHGRLAGLVGGAQPVRGVLEDAEQDAGERREVVGERRSAHRRSRRRRRAVACRGNRIHGSLATRPDVAVRHATLVRRGRGRVWAVHPFTVEGECPFPGLPWGYGGPRAVPRGVSGPPRAPPPAAAATRATLPSLSPAGVSATLDACSL